MGGVLDPTSVEPKPQAMERRALRVREAGAMLGTGRSTIYALVKSGKLGYVRLPGGSMRIPVSEIDRFLQEYLIGKGA